MKSVIALLVAASATTASANDYIVQIHGVVWGNQARDAPLSTVVPGETVTYSFALDSANFTDSLNFPTRGYVIDITTFDVSFSGGVSIGGRDPYPAGQTPYFILRNDDPAVDGFFLGENVDGFPTAINTDQPGRLGDFEARFNVTYGNDPLSSLDISGAVGAYDFTGLTVFGMGLNDDFFKDVVGMDFESMTISFIPAPATLACPLALMMLSTRRRR